MAPRFAHRAMACDWGLSLPGVPAEQAGHAAREAFAEVDRLEQELSRFVPHSDVSRINAQAPGQWLRIGPDCLECLRIALRLHHDTRGLFDPTLGGLADRHRRVAGPEPAGAASEPSGVTEFVAGGKAFDTGVHGRLELDRAEPRVRRLSGDVVLDFGAVGKGYAVDCAIALLRTWGIVSAELNSGQSTVYALGLRADGSAWRVGIRDPDDPSRVRAHVELRDQALSGSGLDIHGPHIIDPRHGRPAEGVRGAWAVAGSAAESDGLSTAFMMMTRAEVESCCGAKSGRLAMRLDADGWMQWG